MYKIIWKGSNGKYQTLIVGDDYNFAKMMAIGMGGILLHNKNR